MLFIMTGDSGGRRSDYISGRQALPEDVQHDVDRVAEAVAAGFRGPVWEGLAADLYNYSFVPLCSAMRHTDKLIELVARSKTPLVMTDEERSTLHRSASDRDHLALMTIGVAMETFPELLKKGGYDPASNPGKGGKPSRLTSYFYGRCGLVFPRVFYNWREERADRFLRHADRMDGEHLAHALGQGGDELVPETVIELCSTLTDMINNLKPRNRAVWTMTVDGLSQGEIADVLGIKSGDVENIRYSLRSKIKKLRKDGALTIPQPVQTEWARRREQDKNRKKVAR
ncbi:sigma factor-like helix-turn-helix DNA-binding protein [Streptomyces globisporus]|uniref:sigma factor-like helix-turn-helix DNA-binding protein n=1 Tax=Streptomyces globisporus TaxID=1908 RepID=UPI0037B27F1A